MVSIVPPFLAGPWSVWLKKILGYVLSLWGRRQTAVPGRRSGQSSSRTRGTHKVRPEQGRAHHQHTHWRDASLSWAAAGRRPIGVFVGSARVLAHNAPRPCGPKNAFLDINGSITTGNTDLLADTALRPAPWTPISGGAPLPVGQIEGYQFGQLDELGRATGFQGESTPNGFVNRTRPNAWPVSKLVGSADGDVSGHLLADVLGGPNTSERNFVPLRKAANDAMQGVEQQVRNQLRDGNTVFYRVEPVYESGVARPVEIKIEAYSTSGWQRVETINNRLEEPQR